MVRQVQSAMRRRGFIAAAEDFHYRASFYSQKELQFIARKWGVS